MTTRPPALQLSNITKRFGALVANDNISLRLDQGEVLALLGENGAGKSTLVSILFGHYAADAGTITAFGNPLPAADPKSALAAGIGMVHQHFALADNLSVLDNVLIGLEPLWWLRSRATPVRKQLAEAALRFGLAVNPDALVGSLSVGEKQRVEILKALVRGAKVLILDEPTAVLTPLESAALFVTLKQMVGQGLSIIFISHKLDEVLQISDRIAVLRAGKLVAECATADATKPQLAQWMMGRTLAPAVYPVRQKGAPLLTLDAACTHGHPKLKDVSLTLHAGEIVAIAGVAGNGQAALADLLCGLVALESGDALIDNKPLVPSPSACVNAGIGRIPEDRSHIGVVGDMMLWENAIIEDLADSRFTRAGFVRREPSQQHAKALVKQFDVRTQGVDVPIRGLSGGNIQKLILGRVLSRKPKLIVANQPTWGLDVGAVAAIHERLVAACVTNDQGAPAAGVLLISEDLEEIMALADRIAVMSRGQLSDARPKAEWTLASLGLAMTASTDHDHEATRAA